MKNLPDAYSDRRRQLLDYYANELPSEPLYAALAQRPWSNLYLILPVMEKHKSGQAAGPLDARILDDALAHMNSRKDCGDFVMNALMRIVHRHWDSPLLTEDQRSRIDRTILDYMYWLDEPGEEQACFTSENHQILFHTAELLAGQRFPDQTFTSNNRLGHWHREHAREFIHDWLDWRIRFGFCEWNSVYFDEDIPALLNLAEFAKDPLIASRSRKLIEVLFYYMSIQNLDGVYGASAGRIYASQILNPPGGSLSPLGWLALGRGDLRGCMSISGISLACSDFVPSAIFESIAHDTRPSVESRQRSSLRVEDALKWGIRPDKLSNAMFFSSLGSGSHRQVIETMRAYIPRKHGNQDWGLQFALEYYQKCDARGESYDPDPCAESLTQVDVSVVSGSRSAASRLGALIQDGFEAPGGCTT